MRSRIRRLFVVVIAASLAVAMVATTAAAAPLVVPAGVTSVSNPNLVTGGAHAWSAGWGNVFKPDYAIVLPAGTTGAYYLVDRAATTVLSTATLGLYRWTPIAGGTLFNYTVDLESPPGTGWEYTDPSAVDVREGVWYLHVLPVDASGGTPLFGTQLDIPVGIDVGAPAQVTNVLVTPDPFTVLPATSIVVPGSAATVVWGGSEYDPLSGSAYFSVYVDGARVVSGETTVGTAVPWTSGAPMWYSALWTAPYKVSIENFAPGRHEIQVSITDRGGNEGAKSATAVVWSDPDVPTISLTTPSRSGRYAPLTCVASDAGGVARVEWSVDGVPVGSSWTAPYSLTADLLGFGVGTHTVTGRVFDAYGRSASASAPITVYNLTVPRITRVTDSPDPFYPVIRNGYKDDSIVRFTLSESAMVWLLVYDSAGNKVRLVTDTWRRRGRRSIKWNGLKDDGTMAPDGTYTIYVGADDAAGNVGWSVPRTTKLRSFIVKRLGRNRVRLIFK
jgi:hypothetical protein